MNQFMADPLDGGNEYHCSGFLEKEHNDPANLMLRATIGLLITLVVAALISRKALEGNWSDIQQSLPGNYRQWLDYESWWILFGLLITTTSFFFSLLYIFYKVVKCCVARNKKTIDQKRDFCKLSILNILISIFVFTDIFAVSSLLISSQYAEYGADELPRRLSYCIDDLAYYKKNTDQRIRVMLTDNFQELSESLSTLLTTGGESVVHRVKKVTGAYAMDSFLNILDEAQKLLKFVTNCENELKVVSNELLLLQNELMKLYRALVNELYECVQNELEPIKRQCQKVEYKLSEIDNIALHLPQDAVSSSTKEALMMLARSNAAQIFTAAASDFKDIEIQLNKKITEKKRAVQTSVKEIQDELILIANSLSTQIRQIKPELLHDVLKQYTGPMYHSIIQYTWFVSLALCAIFSLKVLYFLCGLCYGCFGRWPSDYRNGCCVRSTGAKLFACGVWLAVMLLPVIAAATALLLFIGVNAYSLICWPLDDPFSRPDMISFAERILDVWRDKQIAEDLSPLINQISLADILRSCMRNETLYQMFALDNKYHLYNLREYEKELYDRLERNIEVAFANMSLSKSIATFGSPEQLSALNQFSNVTFESNFQQISSQTRNDMEQFDKIIRMITFVEEEVEGKLPRAVQTIVKQFQILQLKDVNTAQRNLANALKMTTELNDRLSRITMPGTTSSAKLQHAQALLSSNMNEHFRTAANQLVHEIEQQIENYIRNVRLQMSTYVSSCGPLFSVVKGVRSALCQCSVDPFVSLWLFIQDLQLEFVTKEPNPGEQRASDTFVTDSYDTRTKLQTPIYPNVYTMCYGYGAPYIRTRS